MRFDVQESKITKRKLSRHGFLSKFTAGAVTQIEDRLEFDPISMKILNNEKGDALLRSQYRQGWFS